MNLLKLFIGDPDCFSNWNIMKTGRTVEIDEKLHSNETSCISFCSYPNNIGGKITECWLVNNEEGIFFLILLVKRAKFLAADWSSGCPATAYAIAKKLKVCQQAWFSMPWYVCAKIKFKLTSFARLWRLILCQH